jgi:hypothetical protein
MAFSHAESLAVLLSRAGHAEMALLLDAAAAIKVLADRRHCRGGSVGLIGPESEILAYVLAQLDDLADLMDENEAPDAAVLFRMPSQLAAAARALNARDAAKASDWDCKSKGAPTASK